MMVRVAKADGVYTTCSTCWQRGTQKTSCARRALKCSSTMTHKAVPITAAEITSSLIVRISNITIIIIVENTKDGTCSSKFPA